MAYNPGQPRNPAGSSAGGEWAGKGSGASSTPKNVTRSPATAVAGILAKAIPSRLPQPHEPGGINNPHVISEPKNLEYSEDYENQLKGQTKPLTYEERRAVRDFTGYDYKEFRRNDKMGGTDQKTKDFYAGYEKLPAYNGTIYRGLSALNPDQVKQLVSSNTIILDAMSSFTRSPAIAIDFASTFTEKAQGVVLKMQSQTGRSAEHLSQIPTEFEIMAGKGTKYYIHRAYYEKVSSKSKAHLVVEGEELR